MMDVQLLTNATIAALDSTYSKELVTPIALLDQLPIMLLSNAQLVTVLAELVLISPVSVPVANQDKDSFKLLLPVNSAFNNVLLEPIQMETFALSVISDALNV